MSKAVIKSTLEAFFGVRVDEDEENKSENNISVAVDEVDIEILTDALDQALEKEKTDESPNQFK